MRILHVVKAVYPIFTIGGASFVAYQISKGLAKRHEVSIFTTNMSNNRRFVRVDRLPIYFDGVEFWLFKNIRLGPSSNFYFAPEFLKTVKNMIKYYDVVHLHEFRHYMSIITYYYAKKYDIPLILQAHGQLPRFLGKGLLKTFFDIIVGYKILKNAAKVIALNDTERIYYKQMGVAEDKIEVLPNGLDLSKYKELPPKGAFKRILNIRDGEKIILYLGRLHRTKKIDLLVEAFYYIVRRLRGNDENLLLVIAGPDDGVLSELESLVQKLGISDRVLFTGYLDEKTKLKALVDADVFVTPSFYGFPMTFLESCLTGTPIVTTTLGDYLNWIHNNVGFVSSPTARSLANAIYKLLSDDELRDRFSKKCRELIEKEF